MGWDNVGCGFGNFFCSLSLRYCLFWRQRSMGFVPGIFVFCCFLCCCICCCFYRIVLKVNLNAAAVQISVTVVCRCVTYFIVFIVFHTDLVSWCSRSFAFFLFLFSIPSIFLLFFFFMLSPSWFFYLYIFLYLYLFNFSSFLCFVFLLSFKAFPFTSSAAKLHKMAKPALFIYMFITLLTSHFRRHRQELA